AAAAARALETGEPFVLDDVQILRPDGTSRWVIARGSAMHAPDGTIVGLRGIIRDVTRERDARMQREQDERRWRFALEGAGDGVWDWDMTTHRVQFSPRVTAMLGHADGEIDGEVGDGFAAIAARVHGEDAERVQAALDAHVGGVTPTFQADFRLRARDGAWCWVLARGMVMERASDGTPRRMVGTLTDIGAHKAAEAALRDARDAAESATRAKSDFLARMSHELRTPLNSVIGFSQQMAKNSAGNLRPVDLRWLDRVVVNAKHLLALINDVLDLAKVEAQHMSMTASEFDAGALVRDVVASLQPLAHAGVLLHAGTGPGPVWLVSDEAKVRQVLLNITANALRFTTSGEVSVTVHDDPETERVVLEVRDTGPGIRADRLDAIFEAFEQVDGTMQRQHGGTGLGLAISRSFAELLGGTLTVESRVGEGSVFRLALPNALQPAFQAAA
ncbi:MAG: ATP-binding protein, partial [Burkholderiales bacterium]|nr:ATP-binding protein [Burkholderiales bacterium]